MGYKTKDEREDETVDFQRERDKRLHDRRGDVLPFESIDKLRVRAAEMAKPEVICGPFQSGTWGILAGGPGAGKSMFTAALAEAITTGTCFGDWNAPKALSVAILDAEMTPSEINGRVSQAIPNDRLIYCTMDLLERHDQAPFSLGNLTDQNALKAACAGREVVIIDNIEYTLEPKEGRDIWHPETWQQVAPLTRWAKASNKLLILIDHTNKDGNVQGSLAKQRGASFVLKLEPEFVENSDLAFTTVFTKIRYLVDHELKQKRKWWLDDFGWHCEAEGTKKEQVIALIRDGATQKEIVAETGISKGYVSKKYRQYKHLQPQKEPKQR